MKKFLERVDQLLTEFEAKRGKTATAAQERADLLSALIERAKKNEVGIALADSSGTEIAISSQGISFKSRGGESETICDENALESARNNPDKDNIASILAAALRGKIEVRIW